MAGGKETPRQKMIGMMYLVLTALLALNVSKEVISAFVTINDKLDASSKIIDNKIEDDHAAFNMKKMTLLAKKSDLTTFNLWNNKADSLKALSNETVSFLLSECNSMIEASEGKKWVSDKAFDASGNIMYLKPLKDINSKDNYDIPTRMFVGGNPKQPNERGLNVRLQIHNYRDRVLKAMANYTEANSIWSFTPPDNVNGLTEALKSANPKDTVKLAQFYKSLTIPEMLYDDGEQQDLPWSSVTFNHAPIVAAAAMFTSFKVDIKNAQAMATEFMLAKIEEAPYYINKIEPMAMAAKGYINQGDSLQLNVLIAAYDSTESNIIRYGMDEDTIPERWKETQGPFSLSGASAGLHKVKGVIGVKERGKIAWKPWEFDYTVGQPTGIVSLPQMRILYRGFKNEVEGTASGFPNESISLQGSGCRIVREGGKWIALPNSGVRKATISVIAKRDDGSSLNVGTYNFDVKPLPDPELYLGSIKNGQTVSRGTAVAQTRTSTRYDNSVNLTGVNFPILGGTISASGLMLKGKILPGGGIDENARKVLQQSSGKQVMVTVKYETPDRITKEKGILFTVR